MEEDKTEYLNFERLGIRSILMHRVRAFCPSSEVVRHVGQILLDTGSTWLKQPNRWKHRLHERPLFESNQWSPTPKPGFVPNLSVEPSIISALLAKTGTQEREMIRILQRQGIGLFTDTMTVESVDQLAEIGTGETPESRKALFNRITDTLDWNNGGFLINHSHDGVTDEFGFEETSYEIVELCFETLRAMDAIETIDPNEAQQRLQRSVAYFLARSYDVDATAKSIAPSLERVLDELRIGALSPIVLKSGGDLRIKNLSQTSRGFIALGPRGAVVAHNEERKHPQLLVSALNMIEILRGRRMMMIVARTVADNAIREMAQIVDLIGQSSSSTNAPHEMEKKVRLASDHMLMANSLYGLVLSDPGVYLLDGSTLSRLSQEADEWFGMKYLREDNERKMETMHRLWEHNRLKYPLVFQQY